MSQEMGSGDIEACYNDSADESLEKEPCSSIFELHDVTSRAKSMLYNPRTGRFFGFSGHSRSLHFIIFLRFAVE